MTAIWLPKQTDAERHRDDIRRVLNQLDNNTIKDLLRRAQHDPTDEWTRPNNPLVPELNQPDTRKNFWHHN